MQKKNIVCRFLLGPLTCSGDRWVAQDASFQKNYQIEFFKDDGEENWRLQEGSSPSLWKRKREFGNFSSSCGWMARLAHSVSRGSLLWHILWLGRSHRGTSCSWERASWEFRWSHFLQKIDRLWKWFYPRWEEQAAWSPWLTHQLSVMVAGTPLWYNIMRWPAKDNNGNFQMTFSQASSLQYIEMHLNTIVGIFEYFFFWGWVGVDGGWGSRFPARHQAAGHQADGLDQALIQWEPGYWKQIRMLSVYCLWLDLFKLNFKLLQFSWQSHLWMGCRTCWKQK